MVGVLAEETVQRRLVAILALDIVGYSRLMGLDEGGTLSALKHIRAEIIDPAIASHKGRIVKTTGDGVLAEFSSAVGAVTCAALIQDEMRERRFEPRMSLRCGINIGEVILDGDDIFGDGVNVAARLESIAEPGGVALSDDAYRQVRGKIDLEFQDMGEKALKNIKDPIRVWQLTGGAATGVAPNHTAAEASKSPPRKPSIIVLPLHNISGDNEQDYFADGLTQSLTTDLSRFRGLFVIGRNTAFTFKGKAIDLQEVGRSLGVRYALEGSVQKGGDRVRIHVDLTDTQTGGQLWAERFDRDRSDLFEIQDEIARRVAYSLSIQISKAERERREQERSNNPDSVDLVLRAIALVGTRSEELSRRIELFREAIELDKRNADAWAGLARALANLVFAGWSLQPVEDMKAAVNASQNALSINPNDPDAIFAKGQVLLAQRQFGAALEAYQHAVELNPSHPNYHQLCGVAKLALGKPAEAIAPLQEAVRLSPRDFFIADFYMCFGWAYWDLGQLAEAKSWLERSISQNSSIEGTHFILASTLVRMGQLEEANLIIQRLLAEKPGWTIERVKSYPTSAASQPGFLDDLRKAGLPEA